jgi:S-adenosylmethionine:tRNA ribosyltransferase-isomerase
VVSRGDNGEAEIRFALAGAALDAAIAVAGEMPLPPYIAGKRRADAQDSADYQTVFAREQGSVAAPTAGLHFTPALFAALDAKGVAREAVTLHVGLGTFLPVTAQDTSEHRMHAERAMLDAATAQRLNAVHGAGGRIAAVGTTSLRTLESATGEDRVIHPFDGDTDIFITPGYRFRAVDMLLTNFHLPRSTLFMLVSALMGLDVMQRAYAEAIAQGYRFYSYGDACLLMPAR